MDGRNLELIQHPCHEHPLVWRQLLNRYPINHRCNICHSFIFTIHYACLKCKYYVHVSCVAPSLREINHPSHPHHSLTLNDEAGILYDCSICRMWNDCSFYSCHFECEFHIDIYCALRTPTAICENKEKGHEGKPFCHKQPMEEVEVHKYGADDVKIKCYICELPLSSSSQAFTCKICECFFHKSCTELSPKIRHPLHLRHSLVIQLGGGDKDKTKCHVCGKTGFNFTYSCSLCHFYMCIACFSLTRTARTIMYQGHDHLLYLGDGIAKDANIKCCSASYTCWKQLVIASDEHNLTERYRFFCEICDFSLHLLCGPLPCSIKHNCHVHPLTLFESIVEDNSGEYYCDACETTRNPRICVYYCGECKYIAHLHCVISEVVHVLHGDCRDVDLQIVGQRKLFLEMDRHNDVMLENEKTNIIEELKEEEEKEFKPTILLEIIIFIAKDLHIPEDSMNLEEEQKEELKEIERYQAGNREEIWNYSVAFHTMNSLIVKKQDVVHQRRKSTDQGGEQEQQIEESIQDYFSYTRQSFEELVHKLNNFDYPTRWNKVISNDLRLKLVNVGDFMIPWNLADVLKYILVKYGDISGGENTCDSKWKKSLIFFLLCRLLYSMSKIMVEDVTEDLLGDWYSCLQFVKSKGFKVDFINFRLERVVHFYVGLQASRFENAIEKRIDKMISNLQEEIANLEAKLKRCKEDRQVYLYKTSKRRGTSETTNYSMEESLDQDSTFKWKYVADCLF